MRREENIMKRGNLIITILASAFLLLAGTAAIAAKGGIKGKPPPDDDPQDPPEATEMIFWRWGHMDGPHDSSKALGISRDGRTAVGSTLIVDFERAWRSDIDWAIATDDGVPPLYNELQVQEDIGVIAPSRPSAAYAASDMLYEPSGYDLPNLSLDWGGSTPVGTYFLGTVSYAVQWLLPVLDQIDEGDYVTIPDFGGGTSEMVAKDVWGTDTQSIMVGYGHNKRGPLAFRADMTDPLLPVVKTLTITDSVYTEQTLRWAKAEAILMDLDAGQEWIAGYGGTKRGNRAFVTEVLDATTDPITLLSVVLPNIDGGSWAEAYDMVMTDEVGLVVAGRSDSPKGPQACIWWFVDDTTGWVVKGLGGLSKKKKNSMATSVVHRPGSPVGELLVVGWSQTILYDSEAFVWAGDPVVDEADQNELSYMYDLEYILTKTGVGELSGMGSMWILKEATGVSYNAETGNTRMVGWGINPEGGEEAWVVTGYPFDELVFTHE